MDSDRINKWITLIANVGVLVGIALLILEINQNNQLMRVQIEQSRSESHVAWYRDIALSDSLSELDAKADNLKGTAMEVYKQLNPVEQSRVRRVEAARYWDYENLFAQYEQGFISEEYWRERAIPAIRVAAPVWAELWEPPGLNGRRAFKEEIERILRESESDSIR